MGNRGETPEAKRKSNLWLSAVLGVAGLALGWAALELGMGSVQKPGRENSNRAREAKTYEVVGEEPGVIFVQERSQNDDNQFKDVETPTRREEDIEDLDNRTRRIERNAVNNFVRDELQFRTRGP